MAVYFTENRISWVYVQSLGVECSNHSVPTIFFNELAQSFQIGLFHAYEITPTFTPTDILDLGSYAI